MKQLGNDSSIVVLKPDKGNGVVLLDRSDYDAKMCSILSDSSKFKLLSEDPLRITQKREENLRSYLRGLKNNGTLPNSVYDHLAPCGTNPGRLYGLPKVHKPNYPLRPILSAVKTVSYNLAKYLVPILQTISHNEFTLTDSFDFVSQLHGLHLPQQVCLASFDVCSLFTMIPLSETLDICIAQLFPQGVNSVSGLSPSQFRRLLEFSVYDNHFLFNGKLYDQVDGVAMGSPLGPVLANAFLSFHESQWLNSCPVEFKPLFYRRYIDDTFAVFKSVSHVHKFLNYLNSKHPNMKFTVEVENSDKCLPFLDVSVCHREGKFSTEIFLNKTFTGLYMQFDTFLPYQYKTGLIRTLLYRAHRICSGYEAVHKEFCFISNALCGNGFPRALLDKFIRQFWNRIYVSPAVETLTVKKPVVVMCLPFMGKFSFDLRKRILEIVKRSYPQIDLRIVFRPVFRLSSLFRVKDRIPTSLRSCVFYLFTCGGCNATYIGKTKRHLATRIAEHRHVSVRTGKPIKSSHQSAIREHSLSCQAFDSNNFRILCSASSDYELGIFEGLRIWRDKPVLNTVCNSGDLQLFT